MMRLPIPVLSLVLPLLVVACASKTPDTVQGPKGEIDGALARVTVRQQARQSMIDISPVNGTLTRVSQAQLADFIGQTLPQDRAAIHFYLRSAAGPSLLAPLDRAIVNAGGDANKIMYQQVAMPLEPTLSKAKHVKRPASLQVQVVAVTYVADIPHCPIDTHLDTMSSSNTPTSNFGCAYASDFASQIADPADLVHGEDGGATDSVLTSGAIQRLRDNKPTPLLGNGSTTQGIGG